MAIDAICVLLLALFSLYVTRRCHFFSSIGISLMFFQNLALFSTYPLEYTPDFHTFILHSYSTVFHWDFGEFSCALKKTEFERSQFMLLLPLFASASIALLLAARIIFIVAFNRTETAHTLYSTAYDRWAGCSLNIVVILYKNLLRSTFTILDCKENAIRSTVCPFDAILQDRLPYAYLGVLYITLIPLLLFIVGFKNKDFFDDEQVCMRYGSIFKPYRDSCWLFAIYRLLWGLVFTYIPIVNEALQLQLSKLVINTIGLLLLQSYLLCGMYLRVFRFPYSNKLWVFLITLLCLVFISGCGYINPLDTDASLDIVNSAFDGIRLSVYLVIALCLHAIFLERHHSRYCEWKEVPYVNTILESRIIRHMFPLRLENRCSVAIFHNVKVPDEDMMFVKTHFESRVHLTGSK
jgi:hypothetical protein